MTPPEGQALLSGVFWQESRGRDGYWRDFEGIGRPVLYYRPRGWGRTVRGAGGGVLAASRNAVSSGPYDAATACIQAVENLQPTGCW